MKYRFAPSLDDRASRSSPRHFASPAPRIGVASVHRTAANVDLTGVVTDSTNGQPLQSAEITVTRQAGGVVSNTTTDAFGRFTIHNLASGSYTVTVHLLGFRPITRPLTIGENATAPQQLHFAMTPIGLNLEAFQVTATVPISVDTRTGDQVFKQNDFHGAPTNTTSQILQQSIVGAARAPTGEVHIRGQHAEYTYYVDGVPVPAGISGSLNELFDPEVVNQINFQTGGWDAEYGNKNAAIVNVTTKIPSGGFHAAVSSYVGTYDHSTTVGPSGFNGQSLSMSTQQRSVGPVRRRARARSSDMRLEPVVFDPAGNKIINFHNNGNDCFGFAQAAVHAERERRDDARGQPVADEVRRSVRLDRRRVAERPSARPEQLRQPWAGVINSARRHERRRTRAPICSPDLFARTAA